MLFQLLSYGISAAIAQNLKQKKRKLVQDLSYRFYAKKKRLGAWRFAFAENAKLNLNVYLIIQLITHSAY